MPKLRERCWRVVRVDGVRCTQPCTAGEDNLEFFLNLVSVQGQAGVLHLVPPPPGQGQHTPLQRRRGPARTQSSCTKKIDLMYIYYTRVLPTLAN